MVVSLLHTGKAANFRIVDLNSDDCWISGRELIQVGNRLVGNAAEAGVIQVLDGATTLEFTEGRFVALVGNGFSAKVNGLGIPSEQLVLAHDNGHLLVERLPDADESCQAYICVSGGTERYDAPRRVVTVGDSYNPPERGARLPQGLLRPPRAPIVLRVENGGGAADKQLNSRSEFTARPLGNGAYGLAPARGKKDPVFRLDTRKGVVEHVDTKAAMPVMEIDWGMLAHARAGARVKIRKTEWKKGRLLAAVRQKQLRDAPFALPVYVNRAVKANGREIKVAFRQLYQGVNEGFTDVKLEDGQTTRVHLEDLGAG